MKSSIWYFLLIFALIFQHLPNQYSKFKEESKDQQGKEGKGAVIYQVLLCVNLFNKHLSSNLHNSLGVSTTTT
jgi:hypothetical protein